MAVHSRHLPHQNVLMEADAVGKQRRQQQVEPRKLAVLRTHPLQSVYYDALPEHKLAALAADSKAKGLRENPHVMPRNRAGLPANTILDGHMRVRALKMLGRAEIDVVVRYDLADANERAIEREFLDFDFHRTQLDTLARARVALRQHELQKGTRRGGLLPSEEAGARERVGQEIGMSGRNLDRYFRVLKTPIEVQNAFRDSKLGLVDAGKVAGLGAHVQRLVAQRIAAGECPKAVVAGYLREQTGLHVKPRHAFGSFLRSLQRGLRDLDGRVDHVMVRQVMEGLKNLTAARDVIDRLVTRAHAGIARSGTKLSDWVEVESFRANKSPST
jgi:hypothetical protein